jgi:hypothetical protein
MNKHIFLSHSHLDKPAADLVLNALEHEGLRCWVAPRDVSAGGSYAASIVDAIENAHSLILIYTANCNNSPHVLREVERALHVGINIIPIRFDDSVPSKGLAYLLATVHWLWAVEGSREEAVARAVERIVLSVAAASHGNQDTRVEPPVLAPDQEPRVSQRESAPTPGTPTRLWIAGAIGFLVLLGLLTWYIVLNQPASSSSAITEAPVRAMAAPASPKEMRAIEVASPPVTQQLPTSTPLARRTLSEAATSPPIPTVPPENVDQAQLKGTWVSVNQQTNAKTIDVNTSKLILDGSKFVFTRSTKSTFRAGVTRPRGVPKEVPNFSHVTRYTGNVIFVSRAIIKIKLLTVDFPVNYPSWVAAAKELQQKDANYVAARAVWTLRRDGENLVDAEEASTILRPAK